MQEAAADVRISSLATGLVPADGYQPPTVEVICLACEISAYAPDGDVPLF